MTDKEQNEEISKSESYLCEKCDSAFDKEDALETHSELNHSDGNRICGKCDADFDAEDDLEMPRELYHANEYACNICDYATTTKRGLNIHKGTKHKDRQC